MPRIVAQPHKFPDVVSTDSKFLADVAALLNHMKEYNSFSLSSDRPVLEAFFRTEDALLKFSAQRAPRASDQIEDEDER